MHARFIRRSPWTTLAIALVAGVALAALSPLGAHPLSAATPDLLAPTPDVYATVKEFVETKLKLWVRLAALAGFAGWAAGHFLIPWFPAWSQQHRDWVRGALVVLLILFFSGDIVTLVLPGA